MTLKMNPVKAWFRESGTDTWFPATVPGSVHLDLMAAGVIPDPFVADNELQVQWIAERDWEYKVEYDLPTLPVIGEKAYLVCDGLDTLADVTLNGTALGRAENMFRQYRWNVTDLLRAGRNEVHILFESTIAYMQKAQALEPLIGVSQGIPGGAHVRKAPCQFGWDWGPQLPPVGIWKPMRIEVYTAARLDNVLVRQHHTGETVSVSADVVIDRLVDDVQLVVDVQLKHPNGNVQTSRCVVEPGHFQASVVMDVEEPELWWPNGLGGQPLYEFEIKLSRGMDALDVKVYTLGLRTLDLRREKDAYGTSFTFVVNGVPIFAKGANWIPADSFPTRISDAQLEHLIRSAVDSNMNMLRVWGGGFYEEDRFYDMCDRFGILVWQDFIFSCSVYSGHKAFIDNVREEVVQNIRRLRHRASLALWCGNNEMEGGWDSWGWKERMDPKYQGYYDDMFHHVLPDLVAAEDPDHIYWPSSPSSGGDFKDPNGVHAGDTHNWNVWHAGAPYEAYRDHPSRFVSEFGFQSLPPLDTVRTYADEADWNMTSYMMEHHQRNAAGNGKIITYMTAHFQMPKDFPSLVYLTQLLQAEAVRTGVEFWRRTRDCTSGALYWQLNDCWPVASWASIDYFGRWKVLQYAARRFFAPVLLSAEASFGARDDQTTAHVGGYLFQPVPGPYVSLFVTNDLPQDWKGRVVWSLEKLDGTVLRSGKTDVAIGGTQAVQVADLDLDADVNFDNERDVIFVYALWQGDTRVSLGVLPFAPSKHLSLVDPAITVQVTETEGAFVMAVEAQSLARFVELSLTGDASPDWIFSDNYFDLPAGRTVTVTLPGREGWTLKSIRDALQVRSLLDSH